MQRRFIYFYLLLFLLILTVLRMYEIITFNNNELIGYALIIYGLSVYYSSYIKTKKVGLVLGSAIFLTGVVFFILGNFEIANATQIIIPSVILITSLSIFMLYVYDVTKKISLYIALILFSAGVAYIGFGSVHGYRNFIFYISEISVRYWPVLVILVIISILTNKGLKK
ncbi:hypothetical protein BMS3Abin03_00320 [bacterium BMS3Abin03]|nr:hypothetical protein BMS3Abin03_00320 [bacterium BMS3Abin03]